VMISLRFVPTTRLTPSFDNLKKVYTKSVVANATAIDEFVLQKTAKTGRKQCPVQFPALHYFESETDDIAFGKCPSKRTCPARGQEAMEDEALILVIIVVFCTVLFALGIYVANHWCGRRHASKLGALPNIVTINNSDHSSSRVSSEESTGFLSM
jgi:hypothetical protein